MERRYEIERENRILKGFEILICCRITNKYTTYFAMYSGIFHWIIIIWKVDNENESWM